MKKEIEELKKYKFLSEDVFYAYRKEAKQGMMREFDKIVNNCQYADHDTRNTQPDTLCHYNQPKDCAECNINNCPLITL